MRHSTRISAGALALGSALAIGAAGVAGAQTASPVVGHVYTDLNTAHANKVAGYDRHADGSLSPIAGSPFTVGGAGAGKPIGSQGAIQFAANGGMLLVADPGSDQISTLKVASDGSLSKIGVVPSGGKTPASITVAGSQVYVANQGPGKTNYTGFSLSSAGTLTPETGTTVKLASDADPGAVLLNSTGTLLIGNEVGPSTTDSFAVGKGGKLTKAKGSPFAAQGPGPFGSAFDPADPNRVFITNAHGGDNAGTVSAFNDKNGVLSSIGAGPFNNLQTAPCWLVTNKQGTALWTVNTAVPSVSRYSIAGNGTLKNTKNAKFTSGVKGPEDVGLAPDGNSLWVVDTASDEISAFNTAGTSLTVAKAAPTKLPKGAAPFGIAVN